MSDRDLTTGGGGLTGATGDLTFEENDRPLVTGEANEAADPDQQADVTNAQGGRSGSGETMVGGDHLTDREEHL